MVDFLSSGLWPPDQVPMHWIGVFSGRIVFRSSSFVLVASPTMYLGEGFL